MPPYRAQVFETLSGAIRSAMSLRTVPSSVVGSRPAIAPIRRLSERARPLVFARHFYKPTPVWVPKDFSKKVVDIDEPAKLEPPVIEPTRIFIHREKSHRMPIPAIWLRDHCQCSQCVHEVTKQRLLDTFSIPATIKIEACVKTKDGVNVKFSDGHEGHYSLDVIANAGLTESHTALRDGAVKHVLWGSSIKENPPMVDYDAVMNSEDGVKEWTSLIRIYGFCYVDGCPVTPEATQKLLERIAFIRHTHYGGFWDFTSDLASKDTAYTSIALEAHTDNTYFSDPSGLQMFHLLSHTDGEGGASLLVDGFKVAMDLQERDFNMYKQLSLFQVLGHASGNDGINIRPSRPAPVLQHFGNRLVQVRWNNSDRGLLDIPIFKTPKWYNAARIWSAMLKSSENEYWEQLKPGRPLIFDNWRVLHGRSAFTGKRRLCGGYINRDDFMSRYRSLHLENGGSF